MACGTTWVSGAAATATRSVAKRQCDAVSACHPSLRACARHSTLAGTFDSAQEAHDAYHTAKAGLVGMEEANAAQTSKSARKRAAALHPVQPVEGLIGVLFDRDSGLYEAVVDLPRVDGDTGRAAQATGGQFDSAEAAAHAHDALARMYHGVDAPCNYPADSYAAFEPPQAEARSRGLEPTRGKPIGAGEVVAALRDERAIDPVAIDVRGRVDSVSWLVVCSGRSAGHMRRLADMVFKGLLERRLKPPADMGDWGVEGREGDDWMVVDCGEVVVNVMSPLAREAYALEKRYGPGGSLAGAEEPSDEEEEDGAEGFRAGAGVPDDSDGAFDAVDADTMEPLTAEELASLREALGPDFAGLAAAAAEDEEDGEDEEAAAKMRSSVEVALAAGARRHRAEQRELAAAKAPRKGLHGAIRGGAGRAGSDEDPISQWVVENPIPEEWLNKMEAESARQQQGAGEDPDVDAEWHASVPRR